MISNDTYKIKIDGLGLSFEKDVSKEIGDQIMLLVLTGHLPNSPRDISGSTGAPLKKQESGETEDHPLDDDSPSVSIREFLDQCNAKRAPDKITAIGSYLRDHMKQNDFSRDDIIRYFEAAAESVPKNISRDIKWTLKAGWIASRNGRKDAYYITQSGNTALAQKFSSEIVKKTRGLSPSGKKNNNPKTENGQAQ